jgi:inosine-uridine nucleoside N-ribohydrolase
VILDTDIGGDIDDTWALAMMLRSPELDVKLILTETGNTAYRAKIAARMLEIGGRADVPVGVGIHLADDTGPQADWVAGYELSSYPGPVFEDGVGALIDTIMDSPEPITLICIGPLPNVSAALQREPRIAERTRFVGMHGSIRRGYGGSAQTAAEYNIARYPEACQEVFAAPWDITITPLDTCGLVRLEGRRYQAVRDCEDPLVQALIENYRIWARNLPPCAGRLDAELQSSTLFDTVAVYLAFSEELVVMEELAIRVTDDGHTVVEEGARKVNCAMDWRDLAAFEDLLVKRLIEGA